MSRARVRLVKFNYFLCFSFRVLIVNFFLGNSFGVVFLVFAHKVRVFCNITGDDDVATNCLPLIYVFVW